MPNYYRMSIRVSPLNLNELNRFINICADCKKNKPAEEFVMILG